MAAEKQPVVEETTSDNISQYKEEIVKLHSENEKLTTENEKLRKAYTNKNTQFNNLVSIYNAILEKLLNVGVID